jgi:hypothetical protein
MGAATAAVIGATVIGGALSARAQKKAAASAASASKYGVTASTEASLAMYAKTREDLTPYREAGQNALNEMAASSDWADQFMSQLTGVDEYLGQLESLEFEFDPNDEVYKWRQSENERQVNQFFASRGGYDSRAAANMLTSSGMQLQADEVDRQYQQRYLSKYNQLLDLANLTTNKATTGFNMASTNRNELMNLANLGLNAAGQTSMAGQTASNQIVNAIQTNSQNQQNALLQQGAAQAGLYNALGSAPANYLLMQKLLA